MARHMGGFQVFMIVNDRFLANAQCTRLGIVRAGNQIPAPHGQRFTRADFGGVSATIADWPERFRAVRSVRGRGALWGIEWQTAAAAAAFASRLRRSGLLLLGGGESGRVSQLLPPLTITEKQLDHALSLLEAAAPK